MTRSLLALFLAVCMVDHADGFARLCYFGSWTNSRPVAAARFDIQNIDPSVCTHLLYAFGKVDADAKRIVPASPGEADLLDTRGRYSLFNQLKARNSQLRTLLSIGGEAAGKDGFEMVSKAANVDAFAAEAVKSLREWGFDGLDVDWEFPTEPTSLPRLLQALRRAIDDEASTSGKQKLLLTAALGAGDNYVKSNYLGQVPHIAEALDLMLIMAYDFAGSWLDKTYFNAPLHSRNDSRFSPSNSQVYVMEQVWMRAGAPRNKLVLGMTGAGAAFTLTDPDSHGVGAPFTSVAPKGPLYQIQGRLMYPEICRELLRGGRRVWDQEQAVPYAYWGSTWVGYDDAQSIAAKTSWALGQGLGGVMFWMVDFDDWDDKCGNGTFPLLKAARAAAGGVPATTQPPRHPGVVVLRDSAILPRPGLLAILVAMATVVKALVAL